MKFSWFVKPYSIASLIRKHSRLTVDVKRRCICVSGRTWEIDLLIRHSQCSTWVTRGCLLRLRELLIGTILGAVEQCCVSADLEGKEARGFCYCSDCLLIPLWMDRDTEFIYFCSRGNNHIRVQWASSPTTCWLEDAQDCSRQHLILSSMWSQHLCWESRVCQMENWLFNPWGHHGRPSLYCVLMLIELIRYSTAISCCDFCFHNIIKLKQSLCVGCLVFWEQGFYKHVMSIEVCARIPFSRKFFSHLVTFLIKY